MTVQQLADHLSIGYQNAKCLMVSPGFPSFRLGRQWLTSQEAFEKWLHRNQGVTVAARSKPKANNIKRNQRGKYPACSAYSIEDFLKEVQ